LLLYAMSLAASREAFVAVALMFAYFLFVLPERRQIGLVAVALTALASANGNLLHRFLSASASGGSGRLDIWSTGVAAFREHWIFGAGSGSFAAAYDRVYLKVFQNYDMGWSRAAHNMLIQNGVEYGVIGLVLLVGALIFTFRSLPKLGPDHPLFGMRAGLVGALLGLCVAGFFVDLTTAKVFWLALSLFALLRACVANGEFAREATVPV
jgi:O-antigen ligase